MRLRSPICFVTAGLLLTATLTAQQGPSGRQNELSERIEVRAVNVDVIVLDKAGQPVLGLTREDFEIFEDGDEVEVSNFLAVSRTGPAPPTGGPAAPLPAETGSGPAPTLPGRTESVASSGLDLVIVVDNLNLGPSNRKRLVEAAEKLVSTGLNPRDRAMVVSLDDSVKILCDLTTDRDTTLAALEEATSGAPRGSHTQTAVRQILTEIEWVRRSAPTSSQRSQGQDGDSAVSVNLLNERESESFAAMSIYASIGNYASWRFDTMVRATKMLEEVILSMAGLESRKAVLYISDGFEYEPGQTLYEVWSNRFAGGGADLSRGAGQVQATDITGYLRAVVDLAGAHRVAVYAIGAGGGVMPAVTAAEHGTSRTDPFALTNSPTGGRTITPGMEAQHRSNYLGATGFLAHGTGGLLNPSTVSPTHLLETLSHDFQSYYSLAYHPDRSPDEKSHRIKVRVNRPGVKLRHRTSYQDISPTEMMNARIRSGLLLGTAANPLGIAFRFGAETRQKKNRYEVEIQVRIPLDQVVLMPRGEIHEGRLTVYLAARDDEGRTSETQTIDVPLQIPAAAATQLAGQAGGYTLSLTLRDGPHRVAIGVRDELGDRDSVAIERFSPGGAEQ